VKNRSLLRTCVLAGVLLATSCRGSDGTSALSIIDLTHDAGAGISAVDPARHDVVTAATLRLTVEQLLAAHGVSATAMMRSVSTGASDVPERLAALAKNTTDLTAAIGLVYGPTGARAFDQLWSQHTQAFLDYASARSDAARAEARAHLADYERDFSSFVGTATANGVPASAVEKMLHQHNAQMVGQLDAIRAGNAAGAADLAVASIDYLSSIGFALSGGFAAQQPTAFPGPVDNADIAYCSLLGRQVAARAALVSVPAAPLDGRLRAESARRAPAVATAIGALAADDPLKSPVMAALDRAAVGDLDAQQAALDAVAAGYAVALARLR
jgi:hypothetical protein